MNMFVENPVDFAAECVHQQGRCRIVRENFLFLDDGKELTAVDCLQRKCGNVVIMPDRSNKGAALIYHTSCQRLTDAISQMFSGCLQAPVSLPQATSEMTVGELYRRGVSMSYDDCRARADGFDFQGA